MTQDRRMSPRRVLGSALVALALAACTVLAAAQAFAPPATARADDVGRFVALWTLEVSQPGAATGTFIMRLNADGSCETTTAPFPLGQQFCSWNLNGDAFTMAISGFGNVPPECDFQVERHYGPTDTADQLFFSGTFVDFVSPSAPASCQQFHGRGGTYDMTRGG